MEFFFTGLQIPTIDIWHRNKSECPLKHTEITNAIMAMEGGKAPGPDSYPVEFLKKF